jgi:hypothetical protein
VIEARWPLAGQVPEEVMRLVTGSLRAEASRRQRAATKAAGELEEDVASGKVADRRPTSVRIVKLLHEANTLNLFADELEAAAAPKPEPETVVRPLKRGRPKDEDKVEVEAEAAPQSTFDEHTPADAIEASEERP